MNTRLKTLLTYILLSTSFLNFSQNETKIWYFGNKAGLNFNTNPPSILNNSAMHATEGCASIADANGNLLFYTRGDTIFNQIHQVMANGWGLLGGPSSSQSSIIIKQPGSSNIYFVFTLDQLTNTGLRYSIVNMSLAAGMGSVTVKNFPIYTAACTEKLAATTHCNGTDSWVVIHDFNSTNFRAYLVTSTGVTTTAVISPSGAPYATSGMSGCMKFSPNGKKLCSAINGIGSGIYGFLELYDFNNSTGQLSYSFSMSIVPNVYDCEYSPDCTKLYSSSAAGPHMKLLQWNLCAGSPSAIIASQYTIAVSDTSFLTLLRATNGKIYISRAPSSYLSIINNPNIAGAACNFINIGQSIAPNYCEIGLPNFVSTLIKSPFSYVQDLSCFTATFSPPAYAINSTSNCAAYAYSVSSVNWLFGEPASGPANTSTLLIPVHNYSSAGTYTVRLVMSYASCAPDTIYQVISMQTPSFSVNSASATCSGLGTATVAVSLGAGTGAYSYTWLPSAQSNSVAYYLSPGVYTIQIQTNGGNCVSTITTNIAAPITTVLSTVNSTISCSTASVNVSVSGGSGNYTYLWSPGSQTVASVSGINPGVYTVLVNDLINQCSISKTIQVNSLPSPSITVAGNLTICVGATTSLSASGADTYSWSNSATSNSVSISPSVTTSYTVIGTNSLNLCSSTKTLSVFVSKCLGIKNSTLENTINLYPNPAQDYLLINFNEAIENYTYRLSVYTSEGKLFQTEKILFKNKNVELKTNDLKSGIYFIQIQSENSTICNKSFSVYH